MSHHVDVWFELWKGDVFNLQKTSYKPTQSQSLIESVSHCFIAHCKQLRLSHHCTNQRRAICTVTSKLPYRVYTNSGFYRIVHALCNVPLIFCRQRLWSLFFVSPFYEGLRTIEVVPQIWFFSTTILKCNLVYFLFVFRRKGHCRNSVRLKVLSEEI